MSPRLRGYLALEEVMLQLDELGDPAAENLRDAMDPLWYELGDDEQAWLNTRSLGVWLPPPVRRFGTLLDLGALGALRPEPGFAA